MHEVEDFTSPLLQVHEWIMKDAGKQERSFDLQQRLISSTVTRVCALLDARRIFVTVRSLNDRKSSYMRPVYSYPDCLTQYFRSPVQQRPFEFRRDPFPDIKTTDVASSLRFEDDNTVDAEIMHGALYSIDRQEVLPVRRAQLANNDLAEFPFAKRIGNFLSELIVGQWAADETISSTNGIRKLQDAKSQIKRILASQDSYPSHCVVIGRSRVAVADHADKFEHFAAVYITGQTRTVHNADITRQQQKEIIDRFRQLFLAIDLLREADALTFKSGGLALVSELFPVFLNRNIAPATKIGTLVEGLRALLAKHMVGVDFTELDPHLSTPWVYFVMPSFTRPYIGQSFQPHFHIYPKAIERRHPFGSFAVAHPRAPSIVKYLLMRYCDRIPIYVTPEGGQLRLSDDFRRMFQGRCDDFESSSENAQLSPDEIHLASHLFSSTWRYLNVNVRTTEEPRQSLVAYVIEGESVRALHNARLLPKGLLTFESALHDGFSDSDRKILRELAMSVAPLVRSIFHPSASIDYERALARTFQADTDAPLGSSTHNMSDFLFQIVRIDADLFDSISEYIIQHEGEVGDDLVKLGGLSASEVRRIRESHADILVGKSDAEVGKDQDIATEILVARREAFLKHASRLDHLYRSIGVDKVYDFLSACPSNFVWNGYLQSIASALADRRLLNDPELQRIGPGFSAYAVLAASVDGELRQIIKLSLKDKLDQEIEKYRRYVRHKIPLAARVPESGYAFDSSGEASLASHRGVRALEETDAYGALVSDLVDGISRGGTPQSRTFLELLVSLALEASTKRARNARARIQAAIAFNFGNNFALWRWSEFGTRDQDNCRVALSGVSDPITRGYRIEDRYVIEFERVFDSSSLDLIKCGESIEAWCVKHSQGFEYQESINFRNVDEFKTDVLQLLSRLQQHTLPENDLRKYWAISHRDLNARNLAWAEHMGRFVLIDFEHVDYGFWGMDQFRLIVSTICELYAEFLRKDRASWQQKLVNQYELSLLKTSDQLVLFLDRKADQIASGDGEEKLGASSEAFQQMSAGGKAVEDVFEKVYATIGVPPSETSSRASRTFFGALLKCAAIKQFDYSLRAVDRPLKQFIVEAHSKLVKKDELLPLSPGELVRQVDAILPNMSVLEKSDVLARASRFLYSLACVLASRPTTYRHPHGK